MNLIAVDPVTAAKAAKAAVSILTDEEKRKKVLIIAIVPVAGLILLISLFLYADDAIAAAGQFLFRKHLDRRTASPG